MNSSLSPLAESVLYCSDNGLLEDDFGRAIERIFHAGVCDDFVVQEFERRVSRHKLRQAFYGVLPFKTPQLTKGDYPLGTDSDGRELRSSIQFLNAHCLTTAGSGAGKTTLARFKILQVAPRIRGIWLSDLRKLEFAILKSSLWELGIDLHILPGRSLRLNPLQVPEGVELSDWIPRVSDMLTEVFELPPRASKLFQTILFPLYQQYQAANEYPTLYDLFETIKRNSDSNYQARMAILDNLEPVLLSLGPQVLAYRRGWPVGELAKRRIVFELAGISEIDKNLILNTLILSEFTSRIARGVSNPKMNLWICVDEAQRICSASRQPSAIGSQIGLVRGTGIGLDLSVQSMDEILPQVVSNTATKILGRCGSMADYTAAGHSMGLSSEQIQWAQMNLKPGLFIGQLGEGSWRYPFVFRVPAPDFLNGFIGTPHPNLGNLETFPVTYASEFSHWGSIASLPAPADSPACFTSEREFRFCLTVVENPLRPSSIYPKLVGISPNTAKPIRQGLISKGYIREQTLNTGQKGRGSLLLEALPAGIVAIQTHQNHKEEPCSGSPPY